MIFKRKQWHDAIDDLEHEENTLKMWSSADTRQWPNAHAMIRAAEERIKRLKNIIADENENGDYL